ncbi:MAG: pentapeptide repeat-containing protein [Pseudomonadota bacterium]
MTRIISSASAALRGLALVFVAAVALAAGSVAQTPAPGVFQAATCPTSPSGAVGKSFRGQTLSLANFSRMDLRNADFSGSTLKGVMFLGANLTGANFSGATITASDKPTRPTDFTLANLDTACFVGAVFKAPTYLTHSTLRCADFSSTDLSNGNAIFGEELLHIDFSRSCRARFRNTKMNCEFVDQWNQLDLTGAQVSACAPELQTTSARPGRDFSGGIYNGVVFDGLDLSGSKWSGAQLERASFQGATLDRATGLSGTTSVPARLSAARFNNASVRNIDFSYAQLYGAHFTNADLSESSLAGAFLTANTAAVPPVEVAANFDGAHMKDVNLANAQLAGATFQFASFYGSFGKAAPTFPCKTDVKQCTVATGHTCACATASGADLTGTNFSNAYLYGVDFTVVKNVTRTNFSSSILVGANFSGAGFGANGGVAPDFTKAMLQGTVFDSTAALANSSMLNAFVDFGTPSGLADGNFLYLLLGADYMRWRGAPAGARSTCVATHYGAFSAVPGNAPMTCPNGASKVCGTGKTPTSLINWRSPLELAQNAPVAGWYRFDASYAKGTNAIGCGSVSVNPNW